MLKHRQVEAFRAVIISGSVSTAADILGITQPA
ncbi:LysR family transcriptional regulator, partial [Ochrobactrum sp. A-1]|nr:LysR family transcriptional regulator [Ochrobactrum sp. A-1]